MTQIKPRATAQTAPGIGRLIGVDMLNGSAEEWRPVLGYEGYYEVSSTARVRSLKRADSAHQGRDLTVFVSVAYPTVVLSREGGRRQVAVHILMCEAFYGPRPSRDHDARHLNDIPTDNRLENLTWGTKSENAQDAIRNGRHWEVNKTHCKYGHEYSAENTRLSQGRRRCRTCYSRSKPMRELGVRVTPEHLHGTRQGYSYYGCRCDPCTKASTAYAKFLKDRRVRRVQELSEERGVGVDRR